MEQTITITYRWWTDNGSVKDEHRSQLEDAATERILEMFWQGYTGGELITSINDVDYNGWFEINTEVIA